MSKYNFPQVSILFLIICMISSYACLQPDDGTGTVALPPAGFSYQSPSEKHISGDTDLDNDVELDDLAFEKWSGLKMVPHAAGAYRPEAFTDTHTGTMPEWGVQVGTRKGHLPFLERFDFNWASN